MSKNKQPGKPQPGKPQGAVPGGTQRGRQGYSVGTSKRGPRTGATSSTAGGRGGRGRLIAVIAAVVVVIAVAVGAYLLLSGDEDDAYAEGLVAAGCTDTTYPNLGADHIADDAPAPEYNSDPPTSGPHRQAPALWGIYDSPIEQPRLVHNLEHGGLVVQYGDDVPPETRVALRDAVLEDRDFMLLDPYPALGDKIAFTMWTRAVVCTGFDQRVMDGLRERRNQAPAPETPQNPEINRQPNF
jgi:hypothetical protein